MYPSERYKDILAKLSPEKRARVAEYVDEAFHTGDPPSTYRVRTWKELVQQLVSWELGVPYPIEDSPIKDYLEYCQITKDAAGPPPWE